VVTWGFLILRTPQMLIFFRVRPVRPSSDWGRVDGLVALHHCHCWLSQKWGTLRIVWVTGIFTGHFSMGNSMVCGVSSIFTRSEWEPKFAAIDSLGPQNR
jgi:hypothetical protein